MLLPLTLSMSTWTVDHHDVIRKYNIIQDFRCVCGHAARRTVNA